MIRKIPRDFVRSYKEPFSLRAALAQMGFSFAAGITAGLGHAPFSLVYLSVIGFAGVYWLMRRAATPRGSMMLAWAAGAGYFTTTLFWIVEPFFVDPLRHGWMAPFALFFMAGGLAIFWAAAARLARFLAGKDASTLAIGIAWVASLTGAEYLRANIFTGFPWAMPGYIWSETSFAQLGAVIGPFGLTFLTLAFATVLTGLAYPGRVAKLAGVVGVLGPFVIVAGLERSLPPVEESTGALVRLIQPNAPQHLKWDPEMRPVFFQRALDLTSAPSAEKPELVVWPETSLPRLLNDAADDLLKIGAAASGPEIIVGAIRREKDGPRNSLVHLHPGGYIQGVYDKHHLVPFGEYIPLMPQLSALGWSSLEDNFGTGYVAGEGPQIMEASVGGPFQPLICYEAIFPGEVGATQEKARWLLQITNDAWFGEIAGPYQHLAQARMRSIEQGLPMLRAANTGITAVIDARGRVLNSIPLGQAGYLDVRIPGSLASTPYQTLKDYPVLALLLIAFALVYVARERETD